MNDVKCSIIIPHFNNSKDIERLIASIRPATFFEILVIDDYSCEQCFEELRQLSERFSFKLLRNNRTKSAGACRNIGLLHATGQYVLFADSDDYFLDNLWEKIQNYFFSDYDIVYFPPTSIYAETGESANRHFVLSDKIRNFEKHPSRENEFALRLTWYCPWSKLFRLNFIKDSNITFDEVIAANDVMFSVNAGIRCTKLGISQETIYCYVLRRGSLAHTVSREILEARIRVAVQQRSICRKLGFPQHALNVINLFIDAKRLSLLDFMRISKLCFTLGVFDDFRIKKILPKIFSKMLHPNKSRDQTGSSLIVTK